jgi:DNA-binding winged helix-turn-helix (wHTH) protein
MTLERQDAGGQSLLIDAGWRALRAPGAQHWSELAAESNQARLLRALIAARGARPGLPMSAEELIEQVWPGERMTHESAKNRLHVAVTTLRKLGLRDVLQSEGRGYLLAPALRVISA